MMIDVSEGNKGKQFLKEWREGVGLLKPEQRSCVMDGRTSTITFTFKSYTMLYLTLAVIGWGPLFVWGKVNLGAMESWGFNGIRSAMVTLMSPNKIKIREFDYTGEGPAVWFMVGMENEPYNEEFAELKGTIIPDETGSCDRLQRYKNEDITLKLPRGMNFTNYDYLAVFCTRFNHNFGYVQLKRDAKFDDAALNPNEKLPKPCPQDHLDEEEDEEEDEEKEDKVETKIEEEEDEEEEDDNRRKKRKKSIGAGIIPNKRQ